jgi:hypothetical protein
MTKAKTVAALKAPAKSTLANREAWLKKVGTAMVPHIERFAKEATGSPIKFKQWRVSCGWPSKGGLPGNKRRVRGQCWDSSVSGDSNCEIYISPVEAEAREVADILAHELVHALLGTAIGHKAPFPQIVKAMGLHGKPTATFAGPEFWTWAGPILEKAGEYPHAALSPRNRGKVAKTYLIKATAPCCGSVLRLTQKVIDNSGLPLCGCSGEAISYEEA